MARCTYKKFQILKDEICLNNSNHTQDKQNKIRKLTCVDFLHRNQPFGPKNSARVFYLLHFLLFLSTPTPLNDHEVGKPIIFFFDLQEISEVISIWLDLLPAWFFILIFNFHYKFCPFLGVFAVVREDALFYARATLVLDSSSCIQDLSMYRKRRVGNLDGNTQTWRILYVVDNTLA